jgi:hypothetical protein
LDHFEPGPLAVWALCSFSIALFTKSGFIVPNIHFLAMENLLHSHLAIRDYVPAPLLTWPAAMKERCHEVVEGIGERLAPETEATWTPRRSKTIILRSLLRITQHLIGSRYFLELLRTIILFTHVGMVLPSKSAILLLDLFLCGVLVNS